MPTIAEIAKRARVSTATVDRVMNGRNGVNASTAERVKRVIGGELGLRKGDRTAGGKKALRLAFVLPKENREWITQLERVIAQIVAVERSEQVEIAIHRIPTKDNHAAAQELAALSIYDGLAVALPDTPEIKRALGDLVTQEKYVLCLISDIPGSVRHVFVGVDNRAAGRTAAKLINQQGTRSNKKNVLLLSSQGRMSQEIERRIGFVQLVEEHYPNATLIVKADLDTDSEKSRADVKRDVAAVCACTQLAGIYCVGDLLDVLPELGKQDPLEERPTVVAHNATDFAIHKLQGGQVSFLLAQDLQYCVVTAINTLKKLTENLRGAIAIVQPRIEILTTENVN